MILNIDSFTFLHEDPDKLFEKLGFEKHCDVPGTIQYYCLEHDYFVVFYFDSKDYEVSTSIIHENDSYRVSPLLHYAITLKLIQLKFLVLKKLGD